MHIAADTLDQLLRRVIPRLLRSNNWVRPSRGAVTELTGVLLQIRNPRARLSRTELKGTVFSCLGELLWYLAGSNRLTFITYYLKNYAQFSDDGLTIYGAYGPRLFNMRGNNQVENVIRTLIQKPDSRQAVIQLFDASDLAAEHKDIPCTCTVQFLARRGFLHAFTHMRSNDAFVGLPHDIFAFTMLQEIVARSLGMEVGIYKHAIGSLHLYERDRTRAQQFLDEGAQTAIAMPPMPREDPWPSIRQVLRAERAIRMRGHMSMERLALEPYWADLIRLLRIFACFKRGKGVEITRIKKEMVVRTYDSYIDRKRRTMPSTHESSKQLTLPGVLVQTKSTTRRGSI